MTLDFTGAGSRGRRQGRGWVEAGETPLSLSQDKREGRAVCNTAHTAHTHERRSCEYTGSVSQRKKAGGSEMGARGFRHFALHLTLKLPLGSLTFGNVFDGFFRAT